MLAVKKPTFSYLYLCKSLQRHRSNISRRPYARPILKSIDKTNNFVVNCNIKITKYGRSGNIRVAESLFNSMPKKSVVTYTAMLSAYANNGEITSARNLFDQMPQRTVATWNAMITAYARNLKKLDGVEEALRLFLMMPERDDVSYTAMVMGLVNAGRFDHAEELYKSTPLEWRDPFCSTVLMNGYLKTGKLEEAVRIFEGMKEKNVVSWSSMLDGFCKEGRVDEGRELFDLMVGSKNEFTWCSMIDGYMKVGRFEDGFRLFLRMRREGEVGIEPTVLSVIFESCGRNGRCTEGFQVHGLLSHLGFQYDVLVANSIITMYSRFGFINEAKMVFEKMSNKDVVSWNALLCGYLQAGMLQEADELFKKMDSKDSISWATLITGFSNLGLTEKCADLFCKMPKPDDVAWTALISAFVNNEEHEEAIRRFSQMIGDGVWPNPHTLSSLLSACASLASLSLGHQMHAFSIKSVMDHDLSIQNSLVSMYSKCGCIDDAYMIFKSITIPNIVSFNSMITGFAHYGYGEEALGLFNKLVDGGHNLTEVTFLGVLSACSHAGLVEKGRHYLRSMRTVFELEPGPDHYAAMVDLFGRAGLLDEALKLIESMPVEPHAGVWGALLGASRTHMNLDLAKLSALKIFQLEPDNATPYVVLSDIYGITGRRRDEEEMRVSKRSRGIKKSPGCSWITEKDKVKLFLSGDRSHVNFEEIKTILGTIFHDMKHFETIDVECLLLKELK